MLFSFKSLEYLEWDFWNQSIIKSYKGNSEREFKFYVENCIDDIEYISTQCGKDISYIVKHLERFWNCALENEYKDIKDNREIFLKFKKLN